MLPIVCTDTVAVARREVFVTVSAFKPKVKNVSPRAWTEPIAVLLLLLLLSSSSSSSSSSSLLLLLLFMGTVMYKLWEFLECLYKFVVEDFNWQNCTTHKAALYTELYKRWTMSLQPSQLSLRYSVPSGSSM
jgi:hypothetical protein